MSAEQCGIFKQNSQYGNRLEMTVQTDTIKKWQTSYNTSGIKSVYFGSFSANFLRLSKFFMKISRIPWKNKNSIILSTFILSTFKAGVFKFVPRNLETRLRCLLLAQKNIWLLLTIIRQALKTLDNRYSHVTGPHTWQQEPFEI